MGLFDVAAKIGRGEVSVRGEQIPIRMLRESESSALTRMYPMPVAPLMQDPSKGTLAPKVENLNDPVFVVADRAWTKQRYALEVLIATGSVVLGADEAWNRAALDAGLKKISGDDGGAGGGAGDVSGFSDFEIFRMFAAVRGLFDTSAQQRVVDQLVVDSSGLKADQVAEAPKIPKDFATTEAYRTLEVCHEFKIDPRTIGDIEPGLMAFMAMFVAIHKGHGRG